MEWPLRKHKIDIIKLIKIGRYVFFYFLNRKIPIIIWSCEEENKIKIVTVIGTSSGLFRILDCQPRTGITLTVVLSTALCLLVRSE